MKKKLLVGIVLSMVGVFVLGACSNGGKKLDNVNETKKASTAVDKKKENQTIEVIDGEGKKVEVPSKPKRVVVFDNGSLDTIDALSVGDRVVGVPAKSIPNYLSNYRKVSSAGGIKEPDLEKVNQLKPDLIIISGRQEDYKEKMEQIAPTLYMSVDDTDTWRSTKHNIETVGKIFDKEKEARTKVKDLEKEVTDLKTKASQLDQKALTVIVNEGQLSTFGKKSRFDVIYDTFGFKEADEKIKPSIHGQSVSYEYVLEKNPDFLFVVDRTKAIGGDDSHNNVAENELVKKTEAGKHNKVIPLRPDVWYLSGGGLESLHLMVEDAKKALD